MISDTRKLTLSWSHHDCLPYYLDTGDTWTKIDYSQPAKTWMHPFKKGSPTGIVEIPANWYLDDLKVPQSPPWSDLLTEG